MADSAPNRTQPFQSALDRVLRALVFRGDPDSPLFELPISQLRCLHVVSEAEGSRMHDFCAKLEVKLPALSQIVDRLVRRGLIERRPDPADRRAVLLFVSPSARQMIEDIKRARKERFDATVEEISDEDLGSLVSSLEVLAGAAERVQERERGGTPAQDATEPLLAMMPRPRRTRSRAGSMSPSGAEESRSIGKPPPVAGRP